MTASLALCFDAPMQSWGFRSRAIIRNTAMEPTKSGVVGVIAAALGIAREDEPAIKQLAELRLSIRVDREGILERDYHTAQNVPTTLGTGHRTAVTERYYLADALFLVVLEGDPERLEKIAAALDRPQWQLFFGRKAFVPARPLLAPRGLTDAPAEIVVRQRPWLELDAQARLTARRNKDRPDLRTITDCGPDNPEAEVRRDVPIRFTQGHRLHSTRFVHTDYVPLTDDMIPTGDPSCS